MKDEGLLVRSERCEFGGNVDGGVIYVVLGLVHSELDLDVVELILHF